MVLRARSSWLGFECALWKHSKETIVSMCFKFLFRVSIVVPSKYLCALCCAGPAASCACDLMGLLSTFTCTVIYVMQICTCSHDKVSPSGVNTNALLHKAIHVNLALIPFDSLDVSKCNKLVTFPMTLDTHDLYKLYDITRWLT